MSKLYDPGLPFYTTVRGSIDENDLEELHLECRFPDGSKYSAVVIDGECEELAHFLCDALNARADNSAAQDPGTA